MDDSGILIQVSLSAPFGMPPTKIAVLSAAQLFCRWRHLYSSVLRVTTPLSAAEDAVLWNT